MIRREKRHPIVIPSRNRSAATDRSRRVRVRASCAAPLLGVHPLEMRCGAAFPTSSTPGWRWRRHRGTGADRTAIARRGSDRPVVDFAGRPVAEVAADSENRARVDVASPPSNDHRKGPPVNDKVSVTRSQLTAWAESLIHMNHHGTLVQREIEAGNLTRASDLAERARRRAWTMLGELFAYGAEKPTGYCEPDAKP